MIAHPAADSQSAAGWMTLVRDAGRPPRPLRAPIASSTGPGAAASARPARLVTKAASRVTAPNAFAGAVGSVNQMAETSPRPRLIPISAAGASARSDAHRATSRAIGSAKSSATRPSSSRSASPSGLASTNQTVTPRRTSSPIKALT